MKRIISFKEQIKGNIHTHTTRTDGAFSVDEVVEKYEAQGYGFIAITDHRLYYRQDCSCDDMVILNGCEYNCYLENDVLGKTVPFHILALEDRKSHTKNPIEHNDNRYKSLFFESLTEVQALIDDLKSRGNIIIIAHPKNFEIPLDLLMTLEGYDGIEVYNAKAKSDASDYVQELLLMDKDIIFTAVDDSHQYLDDEGQIQYFNGFIVLEDGVLNRTSIVEAIKEKRFYASNGPKIEEIIIEGDRVFITSSDVTEIDLFLYGTKGNHRLIKRNWDGPMKQSGFLVPKDISFIRFECRSENGKKAWTNKIGVHC